MSPSVISTEFEAKVIGDLSTSAMLQNMDKFAFQWKAALLVCQSIDLANNTQNSYREGFHCGELITDFKMQTCKRYDIGALPLKLTNPNDLGKNYISEKKSCKMSFKPSILLLMRITYILILKRRHVFQYGV